MSQNVSDSIISFEGVDVRDVLHGQTTRNFKALELHNPIDGAFCDLKGRVITDFTAVLTADTSVLMRVNSAVTPLLQQHLAKYLMFSKTKMSLLDWRTWGCKGTVDIDATHIRIPRADGHCEVWSPLTAPATQALSPDEWLQFRVSHGMARINEHAIGKYLPQDLNYDLQGLIDFDKGCYTGQEIIARLHYRGQPKRRLSLLTVNSPAQPRCDDKIIDTSTGKSVGSVVEAVRHEDAFHCLCEAVIDVASRDIELCGYPAGSHALPVNKAQSSS